jgi:shikimate kinase
MLILYWPPWSWKSTIGRKLAEHQCVDHIDTDTMIESRYWKISDIVDNYGINYFREVETQVLLDVVSSNPNWVVSLGWWILLRRENLWIIQTMWWRIITLIWDTDILYQRIIADNNNTRPLVINKELFVKLMLERHDHYENSNNTININGKNINTIVNEILTLISTPSPVPRSPWVYAR